MLREHFPGLALAAVLCSGPMRMVLTRDIRRPGGTLGQLVVLGTPFRCYTLEDQDRGLHKSMSAAAIHAAMVPGETAIPTGLYDVGIHKSPSQGREVLHIEKVPANRWINFHGGRGIGDTLGCPLVGMTRDPRSMSVGESDAAVRWLEHDPQGPMAYLRRGGRVTVEIRHG